MFDMYRVARDETDSTMGKPSVSSYFLHVCLEDRDELLYGCPSAITVTSDAGIREVGEGRMYE